MLTPARLATVAFGRDAKEGTHQWLFRLVGRVSKIRESTTLEAGQKIRLAGEFVGGQPEKLYRAPFAIVAAEVAEAVGQLFAAHEGIDRRVLRVLIGYNVWAIRREVGYHLLWVGQAWVRDPMHELLPILHQPAPKKLPL